MLSGFNPAVGLAVGGFAALVGGVGLGGIGSVLGGLWGAVKGLFSSDKSEEAPAPEVQRGRGPQQISQNNGYTPGTTPGMEKKTRGII